MKNDLEAKKNNSAKIRREIASLEAEKTRLYCHNGDLDIGFITKENKYKRVIKNMKHDLEKEKR